MTTTMMMMEQVCRNIKKTLSKPYKHMVHITISKHQTNYDGSKKQSLTIKKNQKQQKTKRKKNAKNKQATKNNKAKTKTKQKQNKTSEKN